jgi:DNA mismatch repair protein MutS
MGTGDYAGEKRQTPMMQQYQRIKAEYQDCILFFRMGDFYEMFFDDAQVASRILEIALTSREKNGDERIPLCGVPYHAASPYVSKLVDRGFKVAICEQVGDAKSSRGLVAREVTRVISPGMVVDEENLRSTNNNFLLGLWEVENDLAMVLLDLSTGDFRGNLISDPELVGSEIAKNEPREAVVFEALRDDPGVAHLIREVPSLLINYRPDVAVESENSGRLDAISGEVIPRDIHPALSGAARAVLRYVCETQKTDVGHIKPLEIYEARDFMVLDETTQRNLELFAAQGPRTRKATLLGIIDETVTSMGGRLLRNWLSYPLMDIGAVTSRQEAVAELKANGVLRLDLRDLLDEVYDLERLNARVAMGRATPRDLVALKVTLRTLPAIQETLRLVQDEMLKKLRDELEGLGDVVGWIDQALVDDAPVNVTEGGIIRDGFHGELDELRCISQDGKAWIARMETEERQHTGISSLKVRYNQVFGYYIEVTKPNLDLVPENYTRKQTLANAERFVTAELKDYESKVLGAEERSKSLEYALFRELRERIAGENRRIQRAASALARLDVLQSLAQTADVYGYHRPTVTDSDELIIREGRHPVVERMRDLEPFVPNDAILDGSDNQVIIITGPNMAGKSTYIRQVALIVILAQMGSFVPATEATVGLIDRVFTRVGASDYLARGESTFMVEMRETARILREATSRSFVVLDEIGRGTSTFDGVSIAWAVAESLHDSIGAKTLFATHYHELTELAMTKARVKNYNVAVREWNGDVTFIRRIVEGGTSRSYGIQVARLAGLPRAVVDRASEVLANLEKGELDEDGRPRLASSRVAPDAHNKVQLSLFGWRASAIYRELKDLEPDTVSPREALETLYRWKRTVEDENEGA